ncbi:MAG: HlyC/CorC family transporter [Planctomycetales bacterium]|nr:HlyC/CorC family transporter [Planctomycetales bacterium]
MFGYTLVIGTAAAVVTLLAAVANKALAEISWHELGEYCRRRRREPTFDDIHDRFETVLVTTETVQVIGLLSALIVFCAGPITSGQSDDAWSLVRVIVIAAATVLLLTVWIPREVARAWGAAYLTHSWSIWRWADRLLLPITIVPRVLRVMTRRLDGRSTEWTDEEELEDEILSIVTEGQHDGLLENDVREMIAGVIELDDSDVADIMTPRSAMDAIPIEMGWADLLEFVVRVGRTRIPVYDKNLDDIVGLLYVKDLLTVLATDAPASQRDLRLLVRNVQRIPRSTRLDELLHHFLNNRSHLAIVVDEFLHVVGLVTIEDVLEEIVGEIVDESDQEELSDVEWVEEGVAEVQGRAHLEEINEMLAIELPTSQEYDTVAGFILHQLGRVPAEGEIVAWQDLKITIQQATKRRIELVRVDLNQRPRVINVK